MPGSPTLAVRRHDARPPRRREEVPGDDDAVLRAFARFWWLIVLCAAVGILLSVIAPSGPRRVASTSTVLVSTPAVTAPRPPAYTSTLLRSSGWPPTPRSPTTRPSFERSATVNTDLTPQPGATRIEVEVPAGASRCASRSGLRPDRPGPGRLAAATAMVSSSAPRGRARRSQQCCSRHAWPRAREADVTALAPTGRNRCSAAITGLLIGLGLAVAFAERPAAGDRDVPWARSSVHPCSAACGGGGKAHAWPILRGLTTKPSASYGRLFFLHQDRKTA